MKDAVAAPVRANSAGPQSPSPTRRDFLAASVCIAASAVSSVGTRYNRRLSNLLAAPKLSNLAPRSAESLHKFPIVILDAYCEAGVDPALSLCLPDHLAELWPYAQRRPHLTSSAQSSFTVATAIRRFELGPSPGGRHPTAEVVYALTPSGAAPRYLHVSIEEPALKTCAETREILLAGLLSAGHEWLTHAATSFGSRSRMPASLT